MSGRRIRQAVVVALMLGIVGLPYALSEEPDGKALYDKKCAMCHGKDGVAKSMAKGSANFNDPEWQKGMTVDAIAKTTTEGKGKMPTFEGKLDPDEIKAVATYVLELKPAAE